ncbi:MAG: NADPH-dependent F420 reductase [Chloroflexota bacterium]
MIGYGSVGRGLGDLFTNAGHQVVAGVREGSSRPTSVESASYPEVAASCSLILLAIPYTAVASAAESLRAEAAGKIVVDATNPLGENWAPLDLGSQTSAGEEVQRLFPESRVVKAFNTVFADNLSPDRLSLGDRRINAFIAGNDTTARRSVSELAQDAGFEPVEAGDISQSRHLEAIAHLNIQLALGMGRGTNSGFMYFSRG